MIDILPEHRWNEIAQVVEREFGAELPNAGKAMIVAETDEESGDVSGFIICEMLLRIGQIYIAKDAKKRLPRKMIEYVEHHIPDDTSVIAIASEARFEKLFEKFQMRKIEGAIFRRDF